MKRNCINIDNLFLDKITSSLELSDSEKINFLKYSSYMTISEKDELVNCI